MPAVAPFSAEWIVAQRWFRSKRRPIAAVVQVDRAPIPGTDSALAVLAVSYVDGGRNDLYLVPEMDGREPDDGDGAWRGLVAAIADGADLAGERDRFRCASTAALAPILDGLSSRDLSERRVAVEQTNTSVVLGADRLMLKLYRLLEPGLNPDLEVSAFLTEVGFAGTPTLAGSITYDGAGPPAAAAMLQEFVPSAGDAWAAMLEALGDAPQEGVEQARAIGELTAELHAVLASRPDHPAFPARRATPKEAAGWRASAERQLSEAVTAVSGRPHDRLVELAPAITARFADTFGVAAGEATVSRIHGDYHLGQLLRRRSGGLAVIDFEGEPARPLAQRRAPASPLRDVAGMLRSLDYAARAAAARHAGFDPEGWLGDARIAFLGGYGGAGPGGEPLLAAFELEKACYEIRYEANNRPDWLWLPLEAVERLAAG